MFLDDCKLLPSMQYDIDPEVLYDKDVSIVNDNICTSFQEIYYLYYSCFKLKIYLFTGTEPGIRTPMIHLRRMMHNSLLPTLHCILVQVGRIELAIPRLKAPYSKTIELHLHLQLFFYLKMQIQSTIIL